MDKIVKQCIKCGQIIGCCKEYDLVHLANNCNGQLKTLNISWDELSIIEDVSMDNGFIQAMLDLKNNDIIEYNLKMSQFRTQLGQQETAKIMSDTRPKCPTCSSTNIKKISGLSKAGSVALFGVFAMGKVSKQWHCNNCNSDF